MSLFDSPNQDAYRGSVDQGSAGPLLGFMDGLDAAWTAQSKVHSLLAVEQSMRGIEQEQIKKMREAGLRPHASLDDSETVGTGPFGGAQFRQGRYSAAAQAAMDGGGWYTDEMIAARDKEIEAAKASRPDLGLMTYNEMFAKVREQSQEIEARNSGPKTFWGEVGSFIGAAAGGMNPVSDPVNAATMLIGGGATIPERLAVQGIGQFGTEAGNMAMTPNTENILLDRQPTFGEDVARLGMAVAGGVGGQALGEVASAGVRRLRTGKWFADLPPPKPVAEPYDYPRDVYGPWEGQVPPRMDAGRPINEYPDFDTFAKAHGYEEPTPWGKTREAALRTALDLDHVTAELQRWDGPAPHAIEPPRTDTAYVRELERGVVYDKPYQKYVDSLDTVDDIARRIDPDLFRQYDKLAAQRAEMAASIERTAGPDLRRNADRPDMVAEHKTWQAATDQQLRLKQNEIDAQMRDLAPLVTRAYGQAEKEWRVTGPSIDTLRFLKKLEDGTGWRFRGEGEPSLTERPAPLPKKEQPIVQATTTEDLVPLASISDRTESMVKVNANADAADRLRANVTENQVKMDETVDAFVTKSAKVSKLDDVEWGKAVETAGEMLAAAEKRAAFLSTPDTRDAVAKAKAELDDLKYVTLPNGERLDILHDRVPMVDENGNSLGDVSVRDFLREMEKDNDALKSVMTCSRPG